MRLDLARMQSFPVFRPSPSGYVAEAGPATARPIRSRGGWAAPSLIDQTELVVRASSTRRNGPHRRRPRCQPSAPSLSTVTP
jgi:hypothetical protein